MKRKLFILMVIALFAMQIVPSFGQEGGIPQTLIMPEQIAEGRPVTITVSDKPSPDREEELSLWQDQVNRFQEMYPNVTIEGLELEYEPTAFVALIAGDQLPTLFRSYFTEPEKFIAQDAVADLTPLFEASGVADTFNSSVLDIATQDGAVYAIPENAYALGLAYNIELLAAAGYDAPPTTWDELVEIAQAVTDKDDGIAGFAFINDGSAATGWHFTNIAYSFGASPDEIIAVNDDGSYSAAFGEGATVDALNFIHDLRWEYDVLPGATLNWGSITEALVSGRVAMAIYAGDQFGFMLNSFPDADIANFGYAPMPSGPNGISALTGGNLWMIDAGASEDEREAAFYFQLWRQLDPAEYESAVITQSEQGRTIGQPVLPMYVGEHQEGREAFEADYNVLPVENYALFNDAVKAGDITLYAEPITAVQDYYAELGVLVSEVLSNERTDPETRLGEVAEEFQIFVLDR